MKSTGIVRKIDELGRVVVPMELRRTMEIGEKDSLEIFTEGDRIIFRKYAPGCTFCGSSDDLEYVLGKQMCSACTGQIVKALRSKKPAIDARV